MATTDEMLDVIDPESGERVGAATRQTAHSEGLWHSVFHCLIVSQTRQTVLLQERAMTKTFPGKLDLSATGHLSEGESVLDGVREVKEELGFDIISDQLISLGTRLLASSSGEGRNRERINTFLYDSDQELEGYAPDEDEVSALVEVDVSLLLGCIAGELSSAPADRWAPGSERVAVEISRSDLVSGDEHDGIDGYWIVVLVMAERHLQGKRPLAI